MLSKSLALSTLSVLAVVSARERWLERDGRAVHLYPRRFGQENPAVIEQLRAACPGEVCGTLSGQAISKLLAGAGECDQQDQADAIIDAAAQFDDATAQNMIALAIEFRQAEKNTPPDFTTNPPALRNSVFCQQAPKNAQLEGLVQAQDPANDPNLFFDPVTKATVQLGDQANTFPLGAAGAAAVGAAAVDANAVSVNNVASSNVASADSSISNVASSLVDLNDINGLNGLNGFDINGLNGLNGLNNVNGLNGFGFNGLDVNNLLFDNSFLSGMNIDVNDLINLGLVNVNDLINLGLIDVNGLNGFNNFDFNNNDFNNVDFNNNGFDFNSLNGLDVNLVDLINLGLVDVNDLINLGLVSVNDIINLANLGLINVNALSGIDFNSFGFDANQLSNLGLGNLNGFNDVDFNDVNNVNDVNDFNNVDGVNNVDDVNGLSSADVNDLNNNVDVNGVDASEDVSANADIGDFGSCSVPQIEFAAGIDGRRETSFQPVDQDSFSQGSAQNPSIITKAVCDQLVNTCDADDVALETCAQAQDAAAAVADQRSGEVADAFNAVFGISTNFAAVQKIDNQGNEIE